MCGIAGALVRGSLRDETLASMGRALAHRGPDGAGRVRFEPFCRDGARWQAGFAHRRLAIFDPRAVGDQPMTSRSGRTTIVLNGEIYNHPELRRRLRDHPFRTGTDTEVLVELFERVGPALLPDLNGMFAFAVWDHAERRLWLARDRLGVKPLFVRAAADAIVFGSELSAVLAGPGFSRRIDADALSSYLDFGFAPGPSTLLEGVEKVAPGECRSFDASGSTTTAWWRPPAAEAAPSDRSWREGLYADLVDAVRMQLRSDVPVGTFLSGGLDSTLITALACRERPGLRSFSVHFPEVPVVDESRYARAAAAALGTRHVEVAVTGDDARRIVPALVAALDEPLADSSLIPVQALSARARQEVTVALSGDGADELFAGYRRYQVDRWLDRWQRVPRRARHGIVRPMIERLGDDRSSRIGELDRRARKVLSVEGLDGAQRDLALARIFGAAEKRALLREPANDAASLEVLERAGRDGRDALDRRLRADLRVGLPDDMLTKVDRGSMARGLEVRVPFLDTRVVERALAIPSRWKLSGGRSKRALHDVFGPTLPRVVRRRRKAGFDAPLGTWLRGPLREWLHDTLDGSRLRADGCFEPDPIERMRAEHDRGVADHSWRLYGLAVVSDWTRRVGVS